jgi:Ca-activated chloride channel homolog
MKTSLYFRILLVLLIATSLFSACTKRTNKNPKTGEIIQQTNDSTLSDNIEPNYREKEEYQKSNALPSKVEKAIQTEQLKDEHSTHRIQNSEVISEDATQYNTGAPASGRAEMQKSIVQGAYDQQYYQPYAPVPTEPIYQQPQYANNESYDQSAEQKFQRVSENPLSTFSIDVDNASYTNTRRMLQAGSLPPKEAVRIEEFINYFNYRYPQPTNGHPFSFTTDLAPCPWNPQRLLLRVGMQGKKVSFASMPPMNLVFLIDVSGSMNPENRLPLLKRAMRSLTDKLRPQDQVSIVVYAGAAGLVLPCTPGHDKIKITEALDRLQAGGSTAGGQGLELAYKTAIEYFKKDGINRIILASDGDFNVGRNSDEEMKKLIEEKRKSGVTLTVLGVGMGNLKDSKMETIANNGNGNYFYIDSYEEAMRVLVDRIDGTLYNIAADVKMQLEFNPAKVKHYRLIGYDNRRLNKEDFNNDKKDAGELGAGHTVTALYEIIPATSNEEPEGSVDPLKYGNKPEALPSGAVNSQEWLTVKFRYKMPGQETSKLITQAVTASSKSDKMGEDFKFCASVAALGMILKDSEYKGNANFAMVEKMASESIAYDPGGYRAEFVRLVKMAESLKQETGRAYRGEY